MKRLRKVPVNMSWIGTFLHGYLKLFLNKNLVLNDIQLKNG
jgi:hypothetical protein